MTYKLNPIVRQLQSSIILCFAESNMPNCYFENGAQLAETEFDKPYLLDSIRAQDSQIVLRVVENKSINAGNWIGEEMVSFF